LEQLRHIAVPKSDDFLLTKTTVDVAGRIGC